MNSKLRNDIISLLKSKQKKNGAIKVPVNTVIKALELEWDSQLIEWELSYMENDSLIIQGDKDITATSLLTL